MTQQPDQKRYEVMIVDRLEGKDYIYEYDLVSFSTKRKRFGAFEIATLTCVCDYSQWKFRHHLDQIIERIKRITRRPN